MRRRFLPIGVAAALSLGVLTATPASAAYAVESITFPGGNSEFYSPFSGPASIKFTFAGTENNATFNVRLRPAGGTAVFTKDVFVTPDEPEMFEIESVSWPALSVSASKQYVVAVYRNGTQIASDSFFLHPRLVSIVSATPNPFLPWIDDDYKDETTIRFKLAATSQPTEAHVYKANTQGKCCGIEVRFANLGTRVPGTELETWVWDGRNDSNGLLAKGDYFVKIRAEDPANIVRWSPPFKVTIARTYRKLATLEKNGIAVHHTGPVTVYRRGGNCFVTKDETDKDLWITCLSASFKVYWRWNLPSGGRIESVGFTLIKVSSNICGATKGHTTTDSFLKVGGVGQFRCRVDKARVSYSVPTPS